MSSLEFHTQYRIENQWNNQARNGRIQHGFDMVDNIHPWDIGSHDCRIRKRREFVAEDGAHHDGAGSIGYMDSQSLRHADQGNAHGSHGSPWGAGHQGHQAAEQTAGYQEDRSREQL